MKQRITMSSIMTFTTEIELPDNWSDLDDFNKEEFLEMAGHKVSPNLCSYCSDGDETLGRPGIEEGEWGLDMIEHDSPKLRP